MMTRARYRADGSAGRTGHGGHAGHVKACVNRSRRTSWKPKLRKALVASVAAVAAAAALTGCTASRNGLSTHDSVCFRVYPEAFAAVHRHGHFAGERYLAPRDLTVELHHVVIPDAVQAAAKVATCLVAFTGHFTVLNVERGWAPESGPDRIAIVVIRQSNLALVATVVLGRIPPRLVFAHVFPRLD